uniref:Fiber n=1 Tax=Zoothera dauma adenovirus TaxID=3073259 RepID=A0AA51NQ77_9ADEN|nr:fiber [Zoothera dauma adenovirus]
MKRLRSSARKDAKGKEKRKRQRSNDVDLVYPFNVSKPVPLPPFVDISGGLDYSGMVLKVKTTNPIRVISGGIGLKLAENSGLQITSDGLRANSLSTVGVTPPLANEDGSIVLKLSDGLHVAGNALVASVSHPIVLKNGSISLNIDSQSGLQVSASGLKIGAGNGIIISGNSISILNASNSGLTVDTGGIKISAGNGLRLNSGQLEVSSGSGITFSSDGALTVLTGNGLQTSNNAVAVKGGNGISVSTSGVTVVAGNGISVNGNGVSVVAGEGILVSPQGVKLKTYENSGIKISDQGAFISLGKGLQIDQGKVIVSTSYPIDASSNNVSLKYSSSDFTLNDNNELSLVAPSNVPVAEIPIQVADGKIKLRYTSSDFVINENQQLTIKPSVYPKAFYFTCGDTPQFQAALDTTSSGATPPGAFNALTYTGYSTQDSVYRLWKAFVKLHLVNHAGMVSGWIYLRWYPSHLDKFDREDQAPSFNQDRLVVTLYVSGDPWEDKENMGYKVNDLNPSGINGATLTGQRLHFMPAPSNGSYDVIPHYMYDEAGGTIRRTRYLVKPLLHRYSLNRNVIPNIGYMSTDTNFEAVKLTNATQALVSTGAVKLLNSDNLCFYCTVQADFSPNWANPSWWPTPKRPWLDVMFPVMYLARQ